MGRITIFIAVIILSFTSSYADAQELEGGWGVPLGVSIDSAEAIVMRKHGLKGKLSDNEAILEYNNCRFGNYIAKIIRLYFYGGHLFAIEVMIPEQKTGSLLTNYTELMAAFTQKHGKASRIMEHYKSPYSKNDAHLYKALSTGNATISHTWFFPSASNVQNCEREILAFINEDANIVISYQDGETYRTVQKILDRKSPSH